MVISVRHLTRLGIKLSTGKIIYVFFNVDNQPELKFWTDPQGARIELTREELNEMYENVKSYNLVLERA